MRASGRSPWRSTARSLATTVAAAPSLMPGALPAVTAPAGPGAPSRRAAADRPRHDLAVETAPVDGGDGAPVALEGEGILVGPADHAVRRHPLGVRAHVAVLARAPQPVGDRGVEHLGVAEPVARASSGQEVGPQVHALHAAGHADLRAAGPA